MKKIFFLALLNLAFSGCSNDDDEPTPPSGNSNANVVLTATSAVQFSMNTGGNTIAGVSGTADWESSTSNSAELGTPSIITYGHSFDNYTNSTSFNIDFGPITYPSGIPSNQDFYLFFTEGSRNYGQGDDLVSMNYITPGQTYSTLDFDQTGSSFEIVDAVTQGEYVRLYGTFSMKLFSNTELTEGFFVASVSNL
jgi:hypothetical protein